MDLIQSKSLHTWLLKDTLVQNSTLYANVLIFAGAEEVSISKVFNAKAAESISWP
jgi:hypothetical protein